MNPVKIGCDDDVSQHAIDDEGQSRIGMRPERDRDVQGFVEHEHPRRQAEGNHDRDGWKDLHGELERMKADGGRDIELGVEVMDAVQAPECGNHVHQVMREERDEPAHGKRRREGDLGRRPKLIEQPVAALFCPEGRADDRDRHHAEHH